MPKFTVEQALSAQHEEQLKEAILNQLRQWHYQEPAVVIGLETPLDNDEEQQLVVLISQFYRTYGYPNPTTGVK